ncbi:butyrophilin subfamily 1 member A1-like isoform X2 [Erythrolamprus reginae]|uniref:butyrophilin subfamily 1 member A1-like isoform X2 n=1 Tax=Erythrolamprus reginae TaxID=121349 RepID=UPI00396CD680
MEDADGYMVIQPSRQIYTDVISKKEGEVFQKQSVLNPSTPTNSCEMIPGILTAPVSFDPDTAHRRLVIARNGKTASWGRDERLLPDSDKRFKERVWVLGQKGFTSGKHCWEIEIKNDGEWAVGVARESVKRNGMTDVSTKEGIWAIAEYWGKGNYVAFTKPVDVRIRMEKKPRRIRVFVDYHDQEVEFFNIDSRTSIFVFSNASFSGERIYPWFGVWVGTELTLHP